MKTLAFWVALILLVTWLFGMIGLYAISAATHLLLLAAIALFAVSFMRDRKSVV